VQQRGNGLPKRHNAAKKRRNVTTPKLGPQCATPLIHAMVAAPRQFVAIEIPSDLSESSIPSIQPKYPCQISSSVSSSPSLTKFVNNTENV
jgi:hypothetical protein